MDRIRVRCALLATLLVAAPLARGDVKTWLYVNDQFFAYELSHMPDLDQRRQPASGIFGLPGNGSMYCVPTSSMNLLAYAANHGFPEVNPGPGTWQLQSMYNQASLWILLLGQNMGTTASGGTGGQGWFDGLFYWLLPTGKFTVTKHTASGNWAPSVTSMAKSALNGAIVAFAYGRYDVVGSWAGIPKIDRDGGHAVTLAKAGRNGSQQTLASRDPAAPNDGQLTTQSTFGNTPYSITPLVVTTSDSLAGLKVMSALNYVAGEKLRLIDQYLAIQPLFLWSWQPSGPGFLLKVYKPIQFLGAQTPEVVTLTGDGSVLEAVVDPDQNALLALVAKGGKPDGSVLTKLELVDGTQQPLMQLPGATTLAFGRHRELYALGGASLKMLDLESPEPKVVETVLPVPGDALAVDDVRGEVVVLALGARKLIRIPVGLGGPIETIAIPTSVPLGGQGSLAIEPRTGVIWIATDKGDAVHGLRIDDQGKPTVIPVALPELKSPSSIDVDDAGHLYVSSLGKILEIAQTDKGWELVASPFAQYAAGPRLHVSRSRTNFDPKTMSGPKWRNLDEKELLEFGDVVIPDCEKEAHDAEYGLGKPGTFGVPHLAGTGSPTIGGAAGLTISKGLPGALPTLLLGVQPLATPFDGGTLLVAPAFALPLPVPFDGQGQVTIGFTVPADPALCGLTVYHQALFADPNAGGHYGVALTNGLARTFGS